MHKKIFFLFFIFSISSFAQDKKFEAGPYIGVEFPFANDKNENIEFNYKVRPSVGAVFKISFSEKFALQPQVLLQLREIDIIKESGSDANFSSVYFAIPVYVNYEIINNLSVLIGPRIDFDLSYSSTYSTGTNGTYSNTTGESPEFSGGIGIQYKTPIKIFISLVGNYAFTRQDYLGDAKNGSYMIGIGRLF